MFTPHQTILYYHKIKMDKDRSLLSILTLEIIMWYQLHNIKDNILFKHLRNRPVKIFYIKWVILSMPKIVNYPIED